MNNMIPNRIMPWDFTMKVGVGRTVPHWSRAEPNRKTNYWARTRTEARTTRKPNRTEPTPYVEPHRIEPELSNNRTEPKPEPNQKQIELVRKWSRTEPKLLSDTHLLSTAHAGSNVHGGP